MAFTPAVQFGQAADPAAPASSSRSILPCEGQPIQVQGAWFEPGKCHVRNLIRPPRKSRVSHRPHGNAPRHALRRTWRSRCRKTVISRAPDSDDGIVPRSNQEAGSAPARSVAVRRSCNAFRRHAAAVWRISFSTDTSSSTCGSVNTPSGPRGLMSVKGDSYNRAGSMTPCSVRWSTIRLTNSI